MSNTIKGTVATKGIVQGAIQAVYGKAGASAYEIALKNGFEGTENEWMESLRGASGVYLGSGDMPEDCNVQIDPDGKVIDMTKYATIEYVDSVVGNVSSFLEELHSYAQALITGGAAE